MDIRALYENYKSRCEDQGIEPIPFQDYKESFEEDMMEDERQNDLA